MSIPWVESAAQLAPYLVPPLVGAVIGYVTNSIAIRMLFRPLRPWRLFGLRIPFTPGIIPRRREELAHSIARMVSRQLLTPDVFERRFGQGAFVLAVRRGIVGAFEAVACEPLATLSARVQWRETIHGLWRALGEAVSSDAEAVEWIADTVAGQVARSWSAVVPTLARVSGEARPLSTVDRGQIERVVTRALDWMKEPVGNWLRNESTRAELETRARRVLRSSIDQLSSIEQLFVQVARSDQRMEARIPEIVTRLIREIELAMESDRMRQACVATLWSWVREHSGRSCRELAAEAGTDWPRLVEVALDALSREFVHLRLREEIRGWLVDPERAGAVAQTAIAGAERWIADHGTRTIAELMPRAWEHRRLLARRLAGGVRVALLRVVTPFVAQLNIEQVVIERINALDIERVEDLLLGIIRRHLSWINVFGALLGALIGGVQVLARLLQWY